MKLTLKIMAILLLASVFLTGCNFLNNGLPEPSAAPGSPDNNHDPATGNQDTPSGGSTTAAPAALVQSSSELSGTVITSPWSTWAGEGGVGTFANNGGLITASITNAGANAWAIQLVRTLSSVPNGQYTVAFSARANASRSINVQLGKGLNFDPWFVEFMPGRKFDLSTEWKNFAFTITKTNTYNDGKLVFELGNIPGGTLATTVNLRDIVVTAVASTTSTTPTNTTPTVSVTPGPGATTAPVPSYLNLVWSDEFDGATINPSNWIFETGGNGWGNNESQFYTDRTTGDNRNAYIENGMLHIVARYETYGGKNYTSARMISKGKRDFRFGRIEARIRAPHNPQTGVMDPGAWPAFWMMGSNFDSLGWPYCGEIDIWETGGNDPKHVSGAVHWNAGGYAPAPYNNVHYSTTRQHPTQLQNNFHIYRIDWDPTLIKWYIDDIFIGQFNHLNLGAGNPFDKAHFLLLNIAIEGRYYFSGTANPANYPQVMQIDWVRVYQ
jgi:beta-glucanase (GH16 family)